MIGRVSYNSYMRPQYCIYSHSRETALTYVAYNKQTTRSRRRLISTRLLSAGCRRATSSRQLHSHLQLPPDKQAAGRPMKRLLRSHTLLLPANSRGATMAPTDSRPAKPARHTAVQQPKRSDETHQGPLYILLLIMPDLDGPVLAA